jgi:hypothetical protein
MGADRAGRLSRQFDPQRVAAPRHLPARGLHPVDDGPLPAPRDARLHDQQTVHNGQGHRGGVGEQRHGAEVRGGGSLLIVGLLHASSDAAGSAFGNGWQQMLAAVPIAVILLGYRAVRRRVASPSRWRRRGCAGSRSWSA